jgi:hypothetical protein
MCTRYTLLYNANVCNWSRSSFSVVILIIITSDLYTKKGGFKLCHKTKGRNIIIVQFYDKDNKIEIRFFLFLENKCINNK